MNSELLYITRKLGYPSSFGKRSGLGDFLEQYPDGIYAETGAGAPMGWESAAVWFGGDSERAAARFERMMSERNELSRVFRTRIAGVLLLTFIYRLKSRMVTAIPIAGGQPQPIDQTWLHFKMPEGGTVSLTKNGTPTEVTLEYSLDNGSTWTEWVESENVRSLTLAAGQTMHVRNTSETSTGFSTGTSNYYNFSFTTETYAGGYVDSLLCKNPFNTTILIPEYCYASLFQNCLTIKQIPNFLSQNTNTYSHVYMFKGCTSLTSIHEGFTLPANISIGCFMGMFLDCTNLASLPGTFLLLPNVRVRCYAYLFYGCTNLILPDNFILPALTLQQTTYESMFEGCRNVNKITTYMIDISATNCINKWLLNVSPSGDFYCPAELTIPTGASGIPSGWTRHDI